MITKIFVKLDKVLNTNGTMSDKVVTSAELINNKDIKLPMRGDFLTVHNKEGEKIFGMVYMVDHVVTNKKQTITIHVTTVYAKR